MTRYAAGTDVSSEKSRAEIERTLRRYGADGFMYGWDGPRALIAFRLAGRHIRFLLPLPDRQSEEFTTTRVNQHSPRVRATPEAAERKWEQACRQRWRAMALIIKAKLEAVESGIVTVEDEFLAQTVLPDGQTVSRWIQPQIAIAYDRGDMPKLLPDYSGDR